ncbi:MAG: T9SS type A sorting domain-containing protein [Bacteroidia bacterium]|nr:T9SS type A sorting domain-containing protein [Bacteroidia bacterium]
MKSLKKKISILFLFFGLSQFAFCQQIEFYKHFSSNYELSFSSIIKVHDGGLVVVGQAFATNGGNYFYVKTDSLGNELWRNTGTYFNGSLDSSNILYDVIETVDHKFIMCGMLTTYSPYKEQILLLCVDSLGAVLWTRLDSLPFAYTSDRQIIGLSNGDFYTVGNKFDTIPKLYIEKHFSNGDTVWTKDISFDPYSAIGLRIINKDNQLFTTGMLLDTVGSKYWAFVVKLDTSGNVLNTIQFIDSGSVRPLNLCLFDSVLYIPFFKSSIAGPLTSIVSYDLSLNELGRSDFPSMDYCNLINDSTFLSTMPGITFHKGNLTGDTIWDYQLIEPDGLVAAITFDTLGCGYAIGRIDDGSSSSTGFIIKICDSLITTNMNTELLSEDSGVIIYPNPSGRRIIIRIPKELKITSELEFNLFDSTGQIVYTNQHLMKTETVLEFPELTSALYYYVLKNDSIHLTGKIIIN